MLAVTLFLVNTAFSQGTAPVDPFDGFTHYVGECMAQWNVPGVGIAVVKDGKIIFMKGFGFRDAGKRLEVTPQTLFALGSCTKAFTSMAAGILTDEGKLDWDTPVIEYLPDFKLYDDYATRHATLRDLLCHRTGLPLHDDVWKDKGLTRRQVYERLRYLKPGTGFREKFQYNNLMYMTVGYLVGRIGGVDWETVVTGRIFKPLGMGGTNVSFAETLKSKNYALPYTVVEGKVVNITPRDLTAVGPAAAVNSNLEDMSRWVLLHLNRGKVGDKRLISGAALRTIHAPHVIDRDASVMVESPVSAYGLGWYIGPYRGHHLLYHAGGVQGYSALVGFMPHDNIGVVILTNETTNLLPFVFTLNIYDRLLGLPRLDWNKRFTMLIKMEKKKRDERTRDEGRRYFEIE